MTELTPEEEISLAEFESEIKEEMDLERHLEWKNTLSPESLREYNYVFGE